VSVSGSARRVLLVVATLGQRPTFLRETLQSIRTQSVPADVVVVAPESSETTRAQAAEFDCRFVPDPGSLTGAINLGVAEGLGGHEFVNWLNDDDLLEPGSLEATTGLLDSDRAAVVAYGACRYIDSEGRDLWISRAGPWANRILSWGPDLIPQPGMLVRASAWSRVGGLDESYRFAFDLDLLLRLRTLGTLRDTGVVVSAFRWHEDSLTVSDRGQSLAESERAKRAALGPTARRLAWAWEGPVRLATRMAAREVSRRARRIAATHG
jgi:GT2 family glycosyltransferase